MRMNIYMCGVGGQGIGVLSEVMVQSCIAAGHNVKSVDTHGLAQRGGIVISHLRIGDKLFTPRIDPGEADLIIALERLEAYRGTVKMLKEGGTVVYYDAEYQPIHVRMGKSEYPDAEEVDEAVRKRGGRLERVHISDLPDPRMQNTALLGRVASLNLIPGVTGGIIEQSLRDVVKPMALEANLAVFRQTAAATA
ncbi:2-oxoacid:acceptor oxidoreductase family protein [bacterium]|nr:2-oxoacid:acceptor oxidoreductase family protein [bacterium]